MVVRTPTTNFRRQAGFTMLEMAVVLFVISLMLSAAIVHYRVMFEHSNTQNDNSNLRNLRAALSACYADTGVYPASVQDLLLSAPPANGKNSSGATVPMPASLWNGPYARNIPVNHYGVQPFFLSRDTSTNPPRYVVNMEGSEVIR
jgi:prepilin-type N-terminal cleavage/methylation domain-containing protein